MNFRKHSTHYQYSLDYASNRFDAYPLDEVMTIAKTVWDNLLDPYKWPGIIWKTDTGTIWIDDATSAEYDQAVANQMNYLFIDLGGHLWNIVGQTLATMDELVSWQYVRWCSERDIDPAEFE